MNIGIGGISFGGGFVGGNADTVDASAGGSLATAIAGLATGDTLVVRPGAYNENDLLTANRKSVSSLVRAVASSIATVTATSTAHGLAVGDTVRIQGATGTDNFNGVHVVIAVPSADSFQYRQIHSTAETAGGTIYAYPLVRVHFDPGATVYSLSTSEIGLFDDTSRGSNSPTFMSVSGDGTFFRDAAGASVGTGNTYAPIYISQSQSAWSFTGERLVVASGGTIASVPAVYATAGDLDIAFTEIRSEGYDCLWIDGSTLFTSFSRRLIAADSPIEFSGLASGGSASIYFVYAESTGLNPGGRITFGGSDTGIRNVQGGYYKGGIYINGESFFRMNGVFIDDAQATHDDCNSVIFNEDGFGAGVFDGCEIVARKASRRIVAHFPPLSSNTLIFRNCKFRVLGTGTHFNESVFGDEIVYRFEGVNHSNKPPELCSGAASYLNFTGGGSFVYDVTGGQVSHSNQTTSSPGIKTTTTNNSATTVVNLPLKQDRVYFLIHKACSRRTDSGTENSVHEHRYRIKVAGSTVTVNSIGTDLNSRETLTTAVPTCVANGQSIDLKVTGETGKTLAWTTTFEMTTNI